MIFKKLLTISTLILTIWLTTSSLVSAQVSIDSLLPDTGKMADKALDAALQDPTNIPLDPSNPEHKAIIDAAGIWKAPLAEVQKLPKAEPETLIASAIRIILSLSGVLATVAILVAGIYYIIAHDNDSFTESAKKIITYSIIGLIVISISFAIFTGLSQINFLS